MAKIDCVDILGNIHQVDELDVINRRSAYGIYIDGDKILLIKDIHAKRWEFPGGGLEEGEDDLEGMAREFEEETGLKLNPKGAKLIHHYKNDFFDLGIKQAWHANRNFYLVKNVEAGNLLVSGNNHDTLAAAFFEIKDVLNFSENEMDPLYIEILNLALKQ